MRLSLPLSRESFFQLAHEEELEMDTSIKEACLILEDFDKYRADSIPESKINILTFIALALGFTVSAIILHMPYWVNIIVLILIFKARSLICNHLRDSMKLLPTLSDDYGATLLPLLQFLGDTFKNDAQIYLRIALKPAEKSSAEQDQQYGEMGLTESKRISSLKRKPLELILPLSKGRQLSWIIDESHKTMQVDQGERVITMTARYLTSKAIITLDEKETVTDPQTLIAKLDHPYFFINTKITPVQLGLETMDTIDTQESLPAERFIDFTKILLDLLKKELS